jgi:uncharacterized protein
MPNLAVSGFDWDDGNRVKCEKHGVSIHEIESVFGNDPLIAHDTPHSRLEQRQRAFGRSDSGRPVFIVFTIRDVKGRPRIRPVSARYMHSKEVRRYEAREDT